MSYRDLKAIDDILRIVHREAVQKALDPTDPDDFLVIIDRLARDFERRSGPIEAQGIRSALRALGIDWPNASPVQQAAALDAARAALERAGASATRAFESGMSAVGPGIFLDTKVATGESLPAEFQVGASLAARDRRAERLVRSGTANFVRDEFGRRRDDLGEMAREVVARGLAEGLGRDEIAAELARVMGNRMVRSEAYYRVVAASYANRARTYSQLLSFQEAGVERYTFEAVLDERTTNICRFYHGQTFEVPAAISVMDQQLEAEDPDAARDVSPWVREGRDADGSRTLFVDRGGVPVRIATVVRSGVGTSDQRGTFSGTASPAELARLGIPYPPLHGNCRSTIVADV